MMFIVAAIAIVVAMVLTLLRAILGPTLYDRVLAGNSFGTKTVLLLGLMGYMTGRPDFLDIALLYALINFAGTIAILKFFDNFLAQLSYTAFPVIVAALILFQARIYHSDTKLCNVFCIPLLMECACTGNVEVIP